MVRFFFEASINLPKTLLIQVSTCQPDCDRILIVSTILSLSKWARNLIPSGFSPAALESSSVNLHYKSTKLTEPSKTTKPARTMVNAMMDAVTSGSTEKQPPSNAERHLK